MFAVKITEWIFSLENLGLLTWTWTHLPIVWDKVPNKFSFFFTPALIAIAAGICITKAMNRPLVALWRRLPGLAD